MKTYSWVAFGFAALFSACLPVAEAVEINHTSISKRVVKETERKYGPEAAERIMAWSNLVMDNKDKSTIEKLALVNNFMNVVPIKSGKEVWGHDHWATPYEMLTRNAGSHADHAIAKYVTLEALGISVDHLHITHVHSMSTPDKSYMVLTYHPERGAMPLVLDTINGQIKPASERADLVPEDSFNDNGLWLSKSQSDGRDDANAEAATHIELWNEMNARMDNELLSTEDPASMQ